jgi:hypothetical protein
MPLSLEEIKTGLQRLRPDAAEQSIRSYLGRTRDKFVRFGDGRYGLATWKLRNSIQAKASTRVSDEDFFAAVDRAMMGSEMAFPELIRAVSADTGLSEIGVRQRLAGAPHVRVEAREGFRHKFVVPIFERAAQKAPPRKVLLRDKVQSEIRSILSANPNRPFKKGLLYAEVVKSVPCQRPTFYQYLKMMQDVRKYQEGKNYFVVYDHQEAVQRIELEVSQYSIGSPLSEELKRPLAKLTVADVDIALFELGRMFEGKLRAYLNAAKVAGSIKVTGKDLSRLVDMVECVVREDVVKKGHHLHTLREERNNRAHGEAPSLHDRTELFNKAHYIADLFLRYIAFFEMERQRIES